MTSMGLAQAHPNEEGEVEHINGSRPPSPKTIDMPYCYWEYMILEG